MKPALSEQEIFLETWAIGLPDTTEQLRFLSPVDLSENTVKLITLREDGTWQELSYHVDGRYLVFPTAEFEMTLAVILIQKNYDLILWVIPAALVVVISTVLYCRKKKQIPSANSDDTANA